MPGTRTTTLTRWKTTPSGYTSADHDQSQSLRDPEACRPKHIYIIPPSPLSSFPPLPSSQHSQESTKFQQQSHIHLALRPELSISTTTMEPNFKHPHHTSPSSQLISPRKPPKSARAPMPPAYIGPPETLPGVKIHHFWPAVVPDDINPYAHLPYYRQRAETQYLPMLGESWVFKPMDMITTTTTTTTTSTTTTATRLTRSLPTPKSTSVTSRTSTPRPITTAAKLGMNAVNERKKQQQFLQHDL